MKVGDIICSLNGKDPVKMSKQEIVSMLQNERPLKIGLKKNVDVPDSF